MVIRRTHQCHFLLTSTAMNILDINFFFICCFPNTNFLFQVISLILSDIIGDPIGLIASGPTVKNSDDPSLPISILEKYKVKDILPISAVKLLESISKENDLKDEKLDFVSNFIIGNNMMALNAAASKASELGYTPFIMTNKLCGLANYVGKRIVHLVDASFLQEVDKVMHICEELNIDKESGTAVLEEIKNLKSGKYLCLLFGGETTVEVKGKGIGGRNQELALAASMELRKKASSIVILSAGTDGIDGPTDAAGAIATPFIVDISKKEGIDAGTFLYDNNSYTFYDSLQNGSWHVKIGHTGTNVMDIIIVLIKS